MKAAIGIIALACAGGFFTWVLIYARSLNEPDPATVPLSAWISNVPFLARDAYGELLYLNRDIDITVVRAGSKVYSDFEPVDKDGLRKWKMSDAVILCYWYPGGSGRVVGCAGTPSALRDAELRKAILRFADR